MLGGFCILTLKAEGRNLLSQAYLQPRCEYVMMLPQRVWLGRQSRQRHSRESIPVRMAVTFSLQVSSGEGPSGNALCLALATWTALAMWTTMLTVGAVWWDSSGLQAWFSHCPSVSASSPITPQYQPKWMLFATKNPPDAPAVWFCITISLRGCFRKKTGCTGGQWDLVILIPTSCNQAFYSLSGDKW